MKKKIKRLSKKKWREIKKLLSKKNRNISQIARKYKISRRNVYDYSWRHNWLQKAIKPKKSLLDKIKAIFKP